MKICHTITHIDQKCGGTSTYLQILSNELVKYINVDIITIGSNEQIRLNKKVKVHTSSSSIPILQFYSRELKVNLNQIETQLFHGDGLWQYPFHIMAKVALKRKIPYIVSPHGTLEPWALKKGKWKKKIALSLYQYKDLARANCIHATGQMEAENIRNLGLNNPIAIIPNGIDLSEYPLQQKKEDNKTHTLLFLSRIHPKKGIEFLIQAWSKLSVELRKNWQVEIIGNGDHEYISSLKKLILKKSLQNEIHVLGPKFGIEKIQAYRRADLFVLPTYSENFGNVIAEALACCIPVITTKGTPWHDLNASKSGWHIEIGVDPLVETLNTALKMSNKERLEMGLNGRKLVEEKYSIEKVAQQMLQLYEWIIYGNNKPNFII